MRYQSIIALPLLMILIVLPLASYSQQANLSPLGFKFGIDKKEAKNIIDSKGKRIVDEKTDSKEMRVIQMQGVIVNLPVDIEGKDVMTELEFYDKKLISTSLVFSAADEAEQNEIKTDFDNYLTSQYGEPVEKDSIMYFDTTTWHAPDTILIMHTNNKDKTLKVEYKYKEGFQAKFEDELDEKRGTVHTDPATQMFLEGDYSKPTGYDEQYGTK